VSCKLSYENVSYTYTDGTQALRGVTFSLGHGEHVALLGPNGAGKSTIMLLANGILLPQEGSVTVGDMRVSRKTLVSVRQRVGLVFQDPDDQLFMTSVFDDVAFGLLNQNINTTAHTHTHDGSDDPVHTHTHTHDGSSEPAHTHTHTHGASNPKPQKPRPLSTDEIRKRVEEALWMVGLEDVMNKAPHDLSFGQRKRAALATILVMRPDFLILDEPSSNLDPRGRRHMMELLKTMEHTILLATHDLNLVWEMCPRSIIIDKGSIVADGPTEELLCDEQLLEEHGLELPAAVRYR